MSSNNSGLSLKSKEFEQWNRGRERPPVHMERTYIVEGRAEVK
jgi:hypothetical protein